MAFHSASAVHVGWEVARNIHRYFEAAGQATTDTALGCDRRAVHSYQLNLWHLRRVGMLIVGNIHRELFEFRIGKPQFLQVLNQAEEVVTIAAQRSGCSGQMTNGLRPIQTTAVALVGGIHDKGYRLHRCL